jgi:hypothetical protein
MQLKEMDPPLSEIELIELGEITEKKRNLRPMRSPRVEKQAPEIVKS